MKFTALKTERVSLNGRHTATFVKGREYGGFDGDSLAKLQEWGIAPHESESDAAKAQNPVEANKMAQPVEQNKMINPVKNNKLGLSKKQ